MELNSLLIEEHDDLQDLFSKYGALALEKQEILSGLVGDAEPELDIENGLVRFNNMEFPIQLIGFLDPNEFTWSWAWDNEEIGFPEELIEEAKAVKEFGEKQNISQFIENVFSASFNEAHILTMTISSLFDNYAYCAVNYGSFVFFVTIESDDIQLTDDPDVFANIINDFHRRFEINHRKALKSYAEIKGYEYKERDDFSLVKVGDDRVVIGLTERKNIQSIKVIKA
ncbi:DUF6882 domain-containing protein [Methanobrevibacter olleyae]|uniref:Uncharacterized protein n=1 Tax=Methanobrevibacter olleyae TaxID=294671 RepID=A0A126QZF4_METOL|nr:DUF6882 domain-containing protein [Methanobrevibacter olleyae]AMK15059.1 hypothetical protein YLM1_0502 [Methanobrevibacter olleyae]